MKSKFLSQNHLLVFQFSSLEAITITNFLDNINIALWHIPLCTLLFFNISNIQKS